MNDRIPACCDNHEEHSPDCRECRIAEQYREWLLKHQKPTGFWAQLRATLTDGTTTPTRQQRQVAKLDSQAEKQEKRAYNMSKKIGRGGRRSAKAAQTAQGLRDAAERKREH